MMRNQTGSCLLLLLALLASGNAGSAADWAGFSPPTGQANGRHIVLLAGDEEYRSEESLPMLAHLLAGRHGFKCTVLFSIDPKSGAIDPNNQTNVPGLSLLAGADLMILQFRFRELPDGGMKLFMDYAQSGKPIIALRTATHAFNYSRNTNSSFARTDWRSKVWPGGFGQQVFGETWISHHGVHGKESTRGVINTANRNHPVLRGVRDVWGPSDVYTVIHLKSSDHILMQGQVLRGMLPESEPNVDKPLMPLVWIRDYQWDSGKTTRSLTTTMGAASDLECEDLRRLLVNACYWLTDQSVPGRADVRPMRAYHPTPFGFDKFIKHVKPSALEER